MYIQVSLACDEDGVPFSCDDCSRLIRTKDLVLRACDGQHSLYRYNCPCGRIENIRLPVANPSDDTFYDNEEDHVIEDFIRNRIVVTVVGCKVCHLAIETHQLVVTKVTSLRWTASHTCPDCHSHKNWESAQITLSSEGQEEIERQIPSWFPTDWPPSEPA